MGFVHEAQCDHCGKRELAEQREDYRYPRVAYENYPGSWFLIARAEHLQQMNMEPEIIGLCSWECVAGYGKKRAEPAW